MNKIYKYNLDLTDQQEIKLPLGAEILTVQNQSDISKMEENICLWAIIDPDETETETRIIRIIGTGHEVAEKRFNLKYLGTVQQLEGHAIWHVFEFKEGY